MWTPGLRGLAEVPPQAQLRNPQSKNRGRRGQELLSGLECVAPTNSGRVRSLLRSRVRSRGTFPAQLPAPLDRVEQAIEPVLAVGIRRRIDVKRRWLCTQGWEACGEGATERYPCSVESMQDVSCSSWQDNLARANACRRQDQIRTYVGFAGFPYDCGVNWLRFVRN